jgi:hypothetical protein
MSDPVDMGNHEEDTLWEITHLRAVKPTHIAGSMEQKSPFMKGQKFTNSLDLEFLVKPEGEWKMLKKYGRCIGMDVHYPSLSNIDSNDSLSSYRCLL